MCMKCFDWLTPQHHPQVQCSSYSVVLSDSVHYSWDGGAVPCWGAQLGHCTQQEVRGLDSLPFSHSLDVVFSLSLSLSLSLSSS